MLRNLRAMKATASLGAATILALLMALFAQAGVASAATVPCAAPADLYAVPGSTTIAGQPITVWGYNTTNAPVTQPGGPTLCVTVGDTVTITLHNMLGEKSSLLFQGQAGVIPDTAGVVPGGTKGYTFKATRPGTYLYEAGLVQNAQHQVAMGLYGALIVRPSSAPGSRAYEDASTSFDDEAVLVLGEIDPRLNNAPDPAAFDMRKYAPRYFLINGRAYPDTAPIPTNAGETVLLRYVNAGIGYHSMELLGTHQTVIALDGSPLGFSRRYVAETFGPGQTADALVSVPSQTTDGSRFAIYDGSLLLHNSNTAGFGGMLTFLAISATPGSGDTTGPITSAVGFASGTLTATVDDTATGGSTITAAEYHLDAPASPAIAMAAVDGTFDTATEAVQATGVVVPPGAHTLYVRGQDAAGHWGPFTSILVDGGDATGPVTRAVVLTPNPANGTILVSVRATADDTATGGSDIQAAEYSIDGAAAVPMDINFNAPIASLSGTIDAAALLDGARSIAIRSQDSAGNWGAAVTVSLNVDTAGPTTSAVSVSPNPNNGKMPINTSTPAVRVTATVSDVSTGDQRIVASEGFIDTVTDDGTGFVFAAVDGTYNAATEKTYGDIPLATIAQLSNGNHTIYVHGKDAAGNWGATSSTILVIDRSLLSSLSFSTAGNTNPPGVTGTADDADIYRWNGLAYSRLLNASGGGSLGLPAGANVDGFDRIDATHFYMSFSGSVNPPGPLGTVQDEDVVYYNNGVWSLFFDGSAHGLGASGLDVDAVSISGGRLFFSLNSNSLVPPGVGGPGDDADIYRWNGGNSFTRWFDASARGASTDDVDGLTITSANRFYVSYSVNTTVPGIGAVQDEDIVYYDNGVWSVAFDGTAHGLTPANLDVDAFDVP